MRDNEPKAMIEQEQPTAEAIAVYREKEFDGEYAEDHASDYEETFSEKILLN